MTSNVEADAPLSLAAAALLWSGMTADVRLLHLPTLVVRPPTPAPATADLLALVPLLGRVDGVALFREHDWRTLLWLRPDPSASDFDRASGYALSIDGRAAVSARTSYKQIIKRVRRKDGTFGGKFFDLRVALFHLQRSVTWAEASMHDVETRADFAACHAAACAAWAREAKWRLAAAIAADGAARARLGIGNDAAADGR